MAGCSVDHDVADVGVSVDHAPPSRRRTGPRRSAGDGGEQSASIAHRGRHVESVRSSRLAVMISSVRFSPQASTARPSRGCSQAPSPSARPSTCCVQPGQLSERIRGLIDSERAVAVEELTSGSRLVPGDHHAVPALRIHVGIDTAQRSDTGRLGKVAVEGGFSSPTKPMVRPTSESSLCRAFAAVGHPHGFDGEAGLGRKPLHDGTAGHGRTSTPETAVAVHRSAIRRERHVEIIWDCDRHYPAFHYFRQLPASMGSGTR